MTERTTCLVPRCRRTTPAGQHPEWICQRHWGALPRDQRRAYLRAKRKNKNGEALARLWRLLSRRAIETAFIDPMA